MHPVLLRQIQRHNEEPDRLSPAWASILAAIDKTYAHNDADRALMERSLELTSLEFVQRAESLRAAEQRFRTLFEASPLPKWLYDVTSLGIVEVNPAATQLYGYTRDEFLAMTLADLRPKEDVGDLLQTIASKDLGVTRRSHSRHRRKDGVVFDVEVLSHPLMIADRPCRLVVAQDVTERRRLEHALQDSEERHRMLFEASPLPTFVFDTETLSFLAVNDAAVQLYGYGRTEFLSLTLDALQISGPDPCPLVTSRSDSAWTGTVRHTTRHRGVVTLEVSSHFVMINGRPARVTIAQDVTERERLENQLRHAQKMDAIGQLAGGIAHDFNNLLAVILGETEFALDGLEHDPAASESLEAVRCAAQRAASLTRQLLAFSRQEVRQPKVLDLNAVVIGVQRMLARTLGENIRLRVQLAPEAQTIDADPGHLEQILVNLAVNARDAMPNGGTLHVEVKPVVLDAVSSGARGLAPGCYAKLSVTDTGIGMDAATQARIFEPFFTTKDVGKGTGLGLAMVFGIVTQSGGAISAESSPGRGTTFRIYFPRVAGTARMSVPSDLMLLDAPPCGAETVLVVEDDAQVRALVLRVLTRTGLTVLDARNGYAALDLLHTRNAPVDLVLTDLVLPGLDGVHFAETVRQFQPGTKILFMSGYTDHSSISRAPAEGEMFLAKPFTPSKLVNAVRIALAAG